MSTVRPRLPPLEPPYSDAVAQTLQRSMPQGSDVPPLNLFRLLARDEALWAAMAGFGRFNLKHDPARYSSIEPRDREIVIQRVCVRCGCEYEWGVHVALFAQSVAITDAQVTALRSLDAPFEALTNKDRLLVSLVDALHDTNNINDELWEQLAAYWHENQLLQLLMLVGWYHAISYVANVSRIPLETWAARFREVGVRECP
jgi:4-carboxymuconolactone decarboxylase